MNKNLLFVKVAFVLSICFDSNTWTAWIQKDAMASQKEERKLKLMFHPMILGSYVTIASRISPSVFEEPQETL